MKLLTIFLLFVVFTYYKSSAQVYPNPGLKAHSVSIKNKISSGTGFFLTDSSNIYLVTAAHVIKDYKVGGYYLIEFYGSPDETANADSFYLDISKCLLQSQGAIDIHNDVAIFIVSKIIRKEGERAKSVIPNYIARHKDKKEYNIPAINTDYYVPFDEAVAGLDVFIIGYPRSLQPDPIINMDRPLFRKGIIAARDVKAQRFICDVPAFHGNSGGLAATHYVDKIDKDKRGYFPIGVVVQFVPYYDYLYDSKGNQLKDSLGNALLITVQNSGYSIIVPIHFVHALIEKIKK